MARVIAWRIHQVAYVETCNAAPLELVHGLHQADYCLPESGPGIAVPRLVIFLAMETKRREVGFDQLLFGLFGFGFSPKDHLEHALQVGEARFAGDFDFAEFRAARTQLLARLGGVVTFSRRRRGGSSLPASRSRDCRRSTVLRIFSIRRFFSSRWYSSERANCDISMRSRDTWYFQADVGALLRFRHPLEASRLPQTFEVELRNLVENLERFLGLVSIFSSVSSSSSNWTDFLDRTCALAEVPRRSSANSLRMMGERVSGLEHEHLAALDAFGDGDFALARQQRYRAHLAQVHANRVVRLSRHPRCKVEVAFLGDGKFVFGFDFGGFRCRRIGGGAGPPSRRRGLRRCRFRSARTWESRSSISLRRVDFSGQDVVLLRHRAGIRAPCPGQ